MAPTVLALCGVAAPADWDGRALAALRGEASVTTESASAWTAREVDYDAAQAADLQRRLELLGYLA